MQGASVIIVLALAIEAHADNLAFSIGSQTVPVQRLPYSFRTPQGPQVGPQQRSYTPIYQGFPSRLFPDNIATRQVNHNARHWQVAAGRGPIVVAESEAGKVTLYKIKDGQCSQSTIEDGVGATLSKVLRGFSEGTCASEGYTQQVRTKTTTMPIIGELTVAYYDKPASELLASTSNDIVSMTAALLFGLFVGSGITFVMFCPRRGLSTKDYEPLLAALS